eukprot:m.123196 g.123196  ORF g.123196 m.123196 type:complete len:697 (-) comp15564_c1_seq3:48-2138(-)
MSSISVRIDAVGDLRHRAEQQLKHDQEKLEFYKKNVAHLTETTEKMENLLTSFLQRLENLQESMSPVHKETSVLTRARDNIRDVSHMLSAVEHYYTVSETAGRRIERGPTYELLQYINTLKEIEEAISYFEEHNERNPELQKLASLRSRGQNALIQEFSDILERCSLPLSDEDIARLLEAQANLIATGTPAHQAPSASALELSADNASALRTLAEWMIGSSHEATCRDLTIKIRRVPIELTLSAFTPESRPSTPASKGRPGLAGTPVRAAKKVHGVLHRTSSMLRKTRPDTVRRQSRMLDSPIKLTTPEPDAVVDAYERGTDPLLDYLDLCLACLRHEVAIIKTFLPRRHFSIVLADLCQPVLQTLLHKLQKIIASAEHKASQKQFFSTLFVFDVLQRMHLLADYYIHLFDSTTNSSLRQDFNQAMANLADIGRAILLGFQESVSSDPAHKLPEDGTVHELTSRTLKFVVEVLEYQEAAASVLARNTHASAETGIVWVQGEEAKAALANWVSSVMTAMKNNLEMKARTYEETTILHVFLLNNFSYIATALKGSIFAEHIIGETCKELVALFEEMIATEKEFYLKNTWKTILNALQVEEVSGTLSKREREMIKERYTTFNEELERIQAVQEDYAIPNEVLREELIAASVNVVVPAFTKFNNVYSGSGFSQKNPQKYLKYTPTDVERLLRALFGSHGL